MNYLQKKTAIIDFKKYVSELLHRHNINGVSDLYYDCMSDYNAILDHNMSCLKAHVKINKILTAYIIEKYQIIQDAYIYSIDPITGIKAV